jgi:GDP-L-fucose synthase
MYPKFTSAPFQEQDLWNGYPEETNAPYGIAKKAVMEMGMAYAKQYGMNIINLIPTNLIGAFDHFETDRSHVVPALIRKIDEAIKSNAPSITVWGDGSASREFLDAKDAARAIYLAYQRYNSPLPVNIGSGNEVSIKKLVELLCKLMNYKGEIEWDQSKPNGQPRRCLDISKARDFGFNARITLDISLETAIDYYRETVHA